MLALIARTRGRRSDNGAESTQARPMGSPSRPPVGVPDAGWGKGLRGDDGAGESEPQGDHGVRCSVNASERGNQRERVRPWELVEDDLKDRWPKLFPHASHDSKENAVGDIASMLIGYKLSTVRPRRRRRSLLLR